MGAWEVQRLQVELGEVAVQQVPLLTCASGCALQWPLLQLWMQQQHGHMGAREAGHLLLHT